MLFCVLFLKKQINKAEKLVLKETRKNEIDQDNFSFFAFCNQKIELSKTKNLDKNKTEVEN